MSDSFDSKVSKLAKSGGVLFAGLVLQLGISFLAQVVLANYLGRVNFGAVSIGVTVLSVAATLSIFGLNTGIARFLPRYDDPADRRGVLVSGIGIALLSSGLAGLLTFLFADQLATVVFNDGSIAPILRIFAVAIPFAAFFKIIQGIVQGNKHSVPKVVLKNFLHPTSRFLLVGVVAGAGLGALAGSLAYAVPYFIVAVPSIYYLYRYTDLFGGSTWVSKHRELLVFSLPLVVSTVMGQMLSNIDIFLLGYFASASTGDIGIYKGVYPFARLLTAGITSFGFVFMPLLSEFHADGKHEEMARLYALATKWMFVFTLPLFLVLFLFPDIVIRVTLGQQYVAGATTLAVLAVGFFVRIVTGLNGDALQSIGQTRIILVGNSVAAVTNVVLNILLIPRYSYLGAAIATTASFFVLEAVHATELYRETGIHPVSSETVLPFLVSLPIVGVFYVFAHRYLPLNLVTLSVLFVAFLIVYGVIVIRFAGIEEEELMLVERFEERFDTNLDPVKRLIRRIQ